MKTSIARADTAEQRIARVLVGDAREPRKVLVIDIGGTSVKLLVSGQHERWMLPFGPKTMPDKMVRKTLEMVADWDYSVVSIGYPEPVLRGRSSSEPYNLGAGWIGFNQLFFTKT